MKAIIIEPRNFAEIRKEVSWRFFWEIKRRYKIAQKLDVVLFFIPYYIYPQCAGISYQFIVSEENIQKNFIFVGYQDMTTNWMYLVPKQLTPSEKAKSSERIPVVHLGDPDRRNVGRPAPVRTGH